MTAKEDAKKYWPQHKASNLVAFSILDRRIRDTMIEMGDFGVPQHILVTAFHAWERFSEEGLEKDIVDLCKAFGDILYEEMEKAIKEIELEDKVKNQGKPKEKKTIGG